MSLSRIVTRPRLLSVTRTGDAPTALFTTALAKSYLNINFSDDDTLIDSLVASATRIVEDRASVALITQTIRTRYKATALPGLQVYRWPVQSISAITTYEEGTGTAATTSNFFLEGAGSRRTILREKEASTFNTDFTEVALDMVCGFGASITSVPEDLVQYVRNVLVWLYDHRDEFVQGQVAEHRIPQSIIGI